MYKNRKRMCNWHEFFLMDKMSLDIVAIQRFHIHCSHRISLQRFSLIELMEI